jgi:hypothetical protein
VPARYLVLVLLTAACTHEADIGGYHVAFHGGRVEAPDRIVTHVYVDGGDWAVEVLTFPYFSQGRVTVNQTTAVIENESPWPAWRASVADLHTIADGWRTIILDRLQPDRPAHPSVPRCSDPVPVGSTWQFECEAVLDGSEIHLRTRIVPAARGFFIQAASWFDREKFKRWSQAFWDSLRPADGTQPMATPGPAVPVAKIMAVVRGVAGP